jgi:hypothetical protein
MCAMLIILPQLLSLNGMLQCSNKKRGMIDSPPREMEQDQNKH